MLGVLEGEPLLVVDQPDAGGTRDHRIPAHFPAVVVAVGEGAGTFSSSPPFDVALAPVPSPGPPWVGTGALDDELALLTEAVSAQPAAAVALAQILRATPPSVDDGLILESLCYSMLLAGPGFAGWLRGRQQGRRPRPAAGSPVTARRVGDRLLLELNRPQAHNAYNRAMRDALCQHLQDAASRPDVRVQLRGAGPSFCSGGDLDEFGTTPDPVTAHLVRMARHPGRLIARMRARVDCEVHGHCIGAGVELPAFAGWVRAHRRASFRLPEVGMGLVPGAGGTVSIPRRIGAPRTAWMALSGRAVSAEQAASWGLVDEVFD